MSKNKTLSVILTCLLVVLMLSLAGCSSSSNNGDKFIMGGTFRLSENESINGDLSIFGGAVNLEKGSTINGNVILIGGTVNADGTINGGINGLGGSITLGDSAVVQGDISTIGVSVNKSDTAVVQGNVLSQSESGVQLPDVPRMILPNIIQPFTSAMGVVMRSLVMAILAVLAMLFLPKQAINVSDSIEDSPVSAGAIGLLTLILFPFVIVLLAITLILIPLSLVAVLIFILGLILGWIAVGYELGERLAALFKSTWAPAVSAGVGTFILCIVTELLNIIPCVGWVIPVLVALVATGGVVISAFGTRVVKKTTAIPSVQVINPPPPRTTVTQEPAATIIESNFAEEKTTAPAMDDADVSDLIAGEEEKPRKRSRKSGTNLPDDSQKV